MFELDQNIPGLFVTSIDLYFQQISPNSAIKVELREVDNSGNITPTVIPYSRSRKSGADINISDDASSPTKFNFQSPVYLQNGHQYAFVIMPEQNDPNFYLWSSRLGENDILSGVRVQSQPYVGLLFVSSNNTTWSPIQDQDLKFT